MASVSWIKCKAGTGLAEEFLAKCTNPEECILQASDTLGYDYVYAGFRNRLSVMDKREGANLRKDRVEMVMLSIPVPDDAPRHKFAALVLDEIRMQLGISHVLYWSMCMDDTGDNAGIVMYVALIPEMDGRLNAKLLCTRGNMIKLNNGIDARCRKLGFRFLFSLDGQLSLQFPDDDTEISTQEATKFALCGILGIEDEKDIVGEDKIVSDGDMSTDTTLVSGTTLRTQEARIVHKSNYLVMSFYGTLGKKQIDPAEQYQYNLMALRMLDVYLSKIDANNPESRYVEFSKNEFCTVMGLHEKTATSGIVTAVKQLKYVDVIFPVQYANRSGVEMMTLFPNARITNEAHNGQITIALECNERLVDLFFDFEKGDYTTYALENILRIKSKYAFVLYNRLKMYLYKNAGKWIASPGELSKLFDVDPSSGLKYINRIIKRCQEEINTQTDITFEYETLLHWRNATAIRFDISAKTQSLIADDGEANTNSTT